MTALITSRGIVLGREKAGEADVMVHLLEESGALRRLRVFGIQGSRRRSNLLTEPGSLIRAVYYEGKGGHGSFKEGELTDRFEEIKSDYAGMCLVAYLLELAELAARGDEHPELFLLLKGAFDQLRGGISGPADDPLTRSHGLLVLLGFFKVRLLKLLGLLGETEICSRCGGPLGARAGWALPEVSFHCQKCSDRAGKREALMAGWIGWASRLRFENFAKQVASLQIADSSLTGDWDRQLGMCLEAFYSRPSEAGRRFYEELHRQAARS